MLFKTRTGHGGHRIVTNDDGFTIATFMAGSIGDTAFACFKTGMVNTNHSLFDEDRQEFLVGTVDQICR